MVKVNDWGGVSSLKTSEVGDSVFRNRWRAKTSFTEFTICSGPQVLSFIAESCSDHGHKARSPAKNRTSAKKQLLQNVL